MAKPLSRLKLSNPLFYKAKTCQATRPPAITAQTRIITSAKEVDILLFIVFVRKLL